MLLFEKGSESSELNLEDLRKGLYKSFEKLGTRKKVLVVPPDFTRVHSRAGDLTKLAYEYYKEHLTDILPALGTHLPMSGYEIKNMFGDIPENLFRVHDWRNDPVKIGEVPSGFIREISGNKVDFSWPVMVNKLLLKGKYDLILSIGQVVPHEVTGMANYNKNISIILTSLLFGFTHFLGFFSVQKHDLTLLHYLLLLYL